MGGRGEVVSGMTRTRVMERLKKANPLKMSLTRVDDNRSRPADALIVAVKGGNVFASAAFGGIIQGHGADPAAQ